MKHRAHWLTALMVAAAVGMSGCYGPFYLTRKVWEFNGQVSDNKWVVEVAYLVMSWIPVYSLSVAADAIIFNSIEFWTGENPMADSAEKAEPKSKRLVLGDTEVELTYASGKAGGEVLRIDQMKDGEAGPTLSIIRQGEITLAQDGDGKLLFTAYTLPDSRVVITDSVTREPKTYTQKEARKVLASLAR